MDLINPLTNLHNLSLNITSTSHLYKKHTQYHTNKFTLLTQHNLLVYPNTNHSLTPQISHRQGTLTIINTKHLHLKSQMITSYLILPNYIQSLFFYPNRYKLYTLINCCLPSRKNLPKPLIVSKPLKH